MRVYLDHGIYSRLNDQSPFKGYDNEACLEIFEAARNGEVTLIISEANRNEIKQSPSEIQKEINDKINSIPEKNIEHVRDTEEVIALRDTYLKENVLGAGSIKDAHHIAAATVHKADLIISLDKDDVDHQGRLEGYWEGIIPKKGVNIVNEEQGYQNIKVCAPQHFREHYEEYQREKGREEEKRVLAIADDLKDSRDEKEFVKNLEKRGYVLSKNEGNHVVLVDFEGKAFDLTRVIEQDPLLQKAGKYLAVETKQLLSVENAQKVQKDLQAEREGKIVSEVKGRVDCRVKKAEQYYQKKLEGVYLTQSGPEKIRQIIEQKKADLEKIERSSQHEFRKAIEGSRKQKHDRLISHSKEHSLRNSRGRSLGKF